MTDNQIIATTMLSWAVLIEALWQVLWSQAARAASGAMQSARPPNVCDALPTTPRFIYTLRSAQGCVCGLRTVERPDTGARSWASRSRDTAVGQHTMAAEARSVIVCLKCHSVVEIVVPADGQRILRGSRTSMSVRRWWEGVPAWAGSKTFTYARPSCSKPRAYVVAL